MARRRKEVAARMGGLFDWLDVLGPEPEPESGQKKPKGLPAPGSRLPALRRGEERGLIPTPPKETLAEKLLSIFDIFGPEEKRETLPARIEEPQLPARAEEREGVWDVLFEPSPEVEERPVYEIFRPPPEEIRALETRYQFVHPGVTRIPYGEKEWEFPTVDEMARHLSKKIDLEKVFRELGEMRSTEGYEDLLADAAFRGIPLYTPVSVIDDRNFFTDFADFYGIPWSVVERYSTKEDLKRDILNTMGIILTEAFEYLKPDYLPGFFTVDYNSDDGRFWLYYIEPWIGRLPGP